MLAAQHLKRALTSLEGWRRVLSGRASYKERLSDLIEVVAWAAKNTKPGYLPPECNRTLVEHWLFLLRRRVPMLVIHAKGLPAAQMFERLKAQVHGSMLAHIREHCVDRCNHEFTSPGSSDLVVGLIADWVSQSFPISPKPRRTPSMGDPVRQFAPISH